MTKRIKLQDVTFTLGDEASGGVPAHLRGLLWCEKLGKGKRHKAAKINGVLVGEPERLTELV